MQGHVYHWRHGWIPLTHYAALVKAHGSHKGAAKYLSSSNGMHGTESHTLKPDHVVLYHGTTRANAELIRKNGIATQHSAGWFTLTDSKKQAEHYANHDGAVVEFHVPRSAIYSRGVKDAVLWQGASHETGGVTAIAHAVRTHLPPSMVHKVHIIGPKAKH